VWQGKGEYWSLLKSILGVHLTLVAVRVGDDPALGRLAEDLGQSVEAPRIL
jgi:hypothetical protein